MALAPERSWHGKPPLSSMRSKSGQSQLSLCDFGDIPKVTHRREELLAHMLAQGSTSLLANTIGWMPMT